MTSTTITEYDLKRCKRADDTGYQLAQGQAYIDCKLANTGGNGLPFEIPLVIFFVIVISMIVFGAVMRRAAGGRL